MKILEALAKKVILAYIYRALISLSSILNRAFTHMLVTARLHSIELREFFFVYLNQCCEEGLYLLASRKWIVLNLTLYVTVFLPRLSAGGSFF